MVIPFDQPPTFTLPGQSKKLDIWESPGVARKGSTDAECCEPLYCKAGGFSTNRLDGWPWCRRVVPWVGQFGGMNLILPQKTGFPMSS